MSDRATTETTRTHRRQLDGEGRQQPLGRPNYPLFQQQGTAWATDRDDICHLLGTARHTDMASIYYGSNACFLVKLIDKAEGESLAIYKPARGEYPLWDFPHGTLYRREVGTYEIDRLIGWGLVPPTVVGRGAYGLGSVQLFIEASLEEEVPVAELRKMALLDAVVNNADRKAEHILPVPGGRIFGIDHGLTLHAEPKLRTVLWHFAGETLTKEEMADVIGLQRLLNSEAADGLRGLLHPSEFRALQARVQKLRQRRQFPDPQRRSVPYRW